MCLNIRQHCWGDTHQFSSFLRSVQTHYQFVGMCLCFHILLLLLLNIFLKSKARTDSLTSASISIKIKKSKARDMQYRCPMMEQSMREKWSEFSRAKNWWGIMVFWNHLNVTQMGGEALPLLCPSSVLQCSAECGAGVRTRSVVCMTNHISSLPLEGCGNNQPAEATPCDNGPCMGKLEWFAGSWSQVSSHNWVCSACP